MITIENEGNGFVIKFSNPGTGQRGFKTKAKDFSEVHTALEHYMGRGHKHGSEPRCPLCRDMMKESIKASKKRG